MYVQYLQSCTYGPASWGSQIYLPLNVEGRLMLAHIFNSGLFIQLIERDGEAQARA